MKIEGTLKPAGPGPAGQVRARPRSNGPSETANEGKVELSSLSSSLNRAEAAMASTPAVDRSRVDEIRQAISEGRFRIDANRIADGLIESVRQMLDAQTPRA